MLDITRPGAKKQAPTQPLLQNAPNPTVIKPTIASMQQELPDPVDPNAKAKAAMTGPLPPEPVMPSGNMQSPPKKRRLLRAPHFSRKMWVIIALITIVVLGGGGAGAYIAFFKKKPEATKPAPVAKEEPKPEPPPPAPTTVASKLTGVQITPAQNNQQIIGVMIENSPDARPQSGLKQAGTVVEAVAEGGITRFLALFLEQRPDYIGPIRSARPYYLDFVMPFDAALAHVGGSPDALNQIRDLNIKDIDQFHNPGAYERIKSRYAPHNVYSSVQKLADLATSKGYTTSTMNPLKRKDDAAASSVTAKTINVNISSFLYNSQWDYEPTCNCYKRSQAGKPHMDEKAGQITPKVVVALVMSKGVASTGIHTTYQTTGSGKAYIFQDGAVIDGSWEKSDRKSQMRLADASGNTVSLNTGQVWFVLVGDSGSVTYKP